MEFILGNAAVVDKRTRSVEDFFLRVDLDGRIIAAATSIGPEGLVHQTILSPDSPDAIAGFKAEQAIYLKSMDLNRLTK